MFCDERTSREGNIPSKGTEVQAGTVAAFWNKQQMYRQGTEGACAVRDCSLPLHTVHTSQGRAQRKVCTSQGCP